MTFIVAGLIDHEWSTSIVQGLIDVGEEEQGEKEKRHYEKS
jgi:hypothetical protein